MGFLAAALIASACREAVPSYDVVPNWPQTTAAYLSYLEVSDGLYRDPPFPTSGAFLDTGRSAALLAEGGLPPLDSPDTTAAWLLQYQDTSTGLFADPSGALPSLEATWLAVRALAAMGVGMPNRAALAQSLGDAASTIVAGRSAEDQVISPLLSLRFALESLETLGSPVDETVATSVRDFVLTYADEARPASTVENLSILATAVAALQASRADREPTRAALVESLDDLERGLTIDSIDGPTGVASLLIYEDAARVLGADYVSHVPLDLSAQFASALRDCTSIEAQLQMPVSWGPLTVGIYLAGLQAREAPALTCLRPLQLPDGSYGALGSRKATPLSTELSRTTLLLLGTGGDRNPPTDPDPFCSGLDRMSPRELLAVARLPSQERAAGCRAEVTQYAMKHVESPNSLGGLQSTVETLEVMAALDDTTAQRAREALTTLTTGVACTDLTPDQAAFVARSTSRLADLIGTPVSCIEEAVAGVTGSEEAQLTLQTVYDVLVSSPAILEASQTARILGSVVTGHQYPTGGAHVSGSSEVDLAATCQAAFVRNALIRGTLPSTACD